MMQEVKSSRTFESSPELLGFFRHSKIFFSMHTCYFKGGVFHDLWRKEAFGGLEMEKSTFTKWALAILIFLLTVHIGSRLFLGFTDVGAREKVQYKVVSTKTIKTGAAYEDLLNRMADQGWQFDHFIELADLAVFRNQSLGDLS